MCDLLSDDKVTHIDEQGAIPLSKKNGEAGNKTGEPNLENSTSDSAITVFPATTMLPPSTNSTIIRVGEPTTITSQIRSALPSALKRSGNLRKNNKPKVDSLRRDKSRLAVQQLEEFLRTNSSMVKGSSSLRDEPFALVALTQEDAQEAKELLWRHHVKLVLDERKDEIASQHVTYIQPDGTCITMKYFSKIHRPESTTHDITNNHKKIPLFIGLHGGGGCPAAVNDQQWENHKQIYQATYQEFANSAKTSLLYVAPRAPTNTWNLWHEPHMDFLLDRLIETLLVTHNVDSNRVYISGYSAGGDGIYKLAPRMADRWAACSAMAGHPNGVSLRGIYNLPFSLHVGGRDEAYNRNSVAREYKATLEEWQQQQQQQHKQEQEGYQHVWATVYENKGHWLDTVDAAAIPWMGQYTRNTFPTTLVWDPDSARHDRFYWVLRHSRSSKDSNHKRDLGRGDEMRVTLEGQTVVVSLLTHCPPPPEEQQQQQDSTATVGPLTLRFNDTMIDMDLPVTISCSIVQKMGDRVVVSSSQELLGETKVLRTIATLHETLEERGDPNAVCHGQIKVDNIHPYSQLSGGGVDPSIKVKRGSPR